MRDAFNLSATWKQTTLGTELRNKHFWATISSQQQRVTSASVVDYCFTSLEKKQCQKTMIGSILMSLRPSSRLLSVCSVQANMWLEKGNFLAKNWLTTLDLKSVPHK